MRSVWLVFCDYGFHSLCPLRNKDKRFVEASSQKSKNWHNKKFIDKLRQFISQKKMLIFTQSIELLTINQVINLLDLNKICVVVVFV